MRARTLAIGAACFLFGCQVVLGLSDLHGVDAGTAHDASRAEGGGKPDAGLPDATRLPDVAHPADSHVPDGGCPTLYVSPAGSNSNSGCTESTPLQTVEFAVLNAVTGGSIRVCTGTYTETNLALDHAVSIYGGYDCRTWSRPSSFGYPNDLAGTPTTIVASANNTQSLAGKTLVVSVQETTPFTLDGLWLQGSSAIAGSSALEILGGSSPLVTHCILQGGLSAGGVATALYVEGSAPEITENLVNFPANADGGTGGSVGIQVVLNGAKAPHIHDNTITAGNGNATNGVGNIGVHLANTSTTLVNVTRAAGAALEHNVITGGRGQGFGDVSNVGLQLEGNLVADVLGNTIWAGEGPLGVNVDAGLAPLTSATIGLRMFNHASANIEGNRIFGGVSTSRGGGTVGIACIGGDAIVVTNNLIHGGNDSPGPPNAAAIELVETASATIEDNTIYAGLGASGDGGISNALFEHDLDAAVAVRGNILAGAGSSAADVAIVVDKCGQIGPFDHNLFVNLAGGMLSSSTCHKDGGAKLSGFAETEALLHGTDNLVLATSCDAGQPDATICGVSSCPSVGSCLTGLLTQWAPNGGGSSILDKGSWALTDASSCRIKRGGVNLAQQAGGPAIPNDYSDAGRPDAPSIGAYQSGGTCPP